MFLVLFFFLVLFLFLWMFWCCFWLLVLCVVCGFELMVFLRWCSLMICRMMSLLIVVLWS